jgi:hypothetical protein
MIKSLVEGLANPVSDLISEFIVDKDKANEIAFKIETLASRQAHDSALSQMAVNKAEAESPSIFKGGWRPFVGWTCGMALALNFLIFPVFGPILVAYTTIAIVPLDMATMTPILLGMLGLAGARSYEKRHNVAAK